MDNSDHDFTEYQNEYVEIKEEFTTTMIKSRPTNSLDFLKFNSEEYKKYKLTERIKEKINVFKFSEKYKNEIIDLCLHYKNKSDTLGIQLPFTDLIAIITYKIIKKNNLFFSQKELEEKLHLDKSKYLKFSNLITIGDKHYFSHEKNDTEFCSEVYTYCLYLLNRIKDSNDILHISNSKENLDIMVDNFLNNTDYKNMYDEVRKNIKQFLFETETGETFQSFFKNKILIENLSAAIIKYTLSIKGMNIKLNSFKTFFNLSPSSISKAGKMFVQYIKQK